ncbi:glutathione s-n-terminal domain containing protein [Stylonychia lemnae]|uniref:glutathione transferase n=1 Tax=Stylonychia lemnae TaxID=5949 RepID=A0A077ZX95_STYLE|nr:glutathione s-n-terminal domain containing protein [Stylonychia lemnae]|eukprot:CDW74536.1 glutathione s-n-terminal domain containing protein [Stylonychia lemnae]
MESKVVLVYWGGLRGAAQIPRLALEYAGVSYDQSLYTNDEDWFKRDKPTLPMVLPNLPYLKDGDLLISEHDAILRYVARKYKPELSGKTIEDFALVENYLCFWTKIYIEAVNLCYTPDVTEERRVEFFKKHEEKFQRLDKALEGKDHFVGDYTTNADLYFYHIASVLMCIHKDTVEKYQNLVNLFWSLDKHEWLQNFQKSDRWIHQLNGDEASINNKQ